MIALGQLKGEYCHNFGFGIECLTFLDNKRFEYSHAHCTGIDKGKWIYTIVDKNLILQFQTDSANVKYQAVFEKESTTSDTITIEVYVFSITDKEPLFLQAF